MGRKKNNNKVCHYSSSSNKENYHMCLCWWHTCALIDIMHYVLCMCPYVWIVCSTHTHTHIQFFLFHISFVRFLICHCPFVARFLAFDCCYNITNDSLWYNKTNVIMFGKDPQIYHTDDGKKENEADNNKNNNSGNRVSCVAHTTTKNWAFDTRIYSIGSSH